jgi:hypothetical protein
VQAGKDGSQVEKEQQDVQGDGDRQKELKIVLALGHHPAPEARRL